MKTVGMICIAIALGVFASILNYTWLMSQKPAMTEYLILNKRIEQNEVISETILGTISLPSENQALKNFFVEAKYIDLVKNTKAKNSYEEGMLLLGEDFTRERSLLPEYGVLGPFTLMKEQTSRTSDTVVVVKARYKADPAMPGEFTFDDNTRRLIEIVELQRSGSANRSGRSELRFVAAIACPDDDAEDTSPVSPKDRNFGIVVQLPSGMPVPASALRNGKIAFLVPRDVIPSAKSDSKNRSRP